MPAAEFFRRAVCISCIALAAGCTSLPRDLQAPDVSLTGLSVVDAKASGQHFRVTLRVKNPNDVDIPVKSVEFSARLAGQGVLMGQSEKPVLLAAGGTQNVTVDVQTDLISSVSSLLAVGIGPDDALPYEINGRLSVGGRMSRSFPFSYRGQVPLTATLGTR